jgi:hypothetical protein
MADIPSQRPSRSDAAERKFADALRAAAWTFEKEKDGRFLGSIMACQAVIDFIKARGGPAELAGPFVQIKQAFASLEKGGKPTLFSKKISPLKERARSPERKNIHQNAVAALEVLVQLGDSLSVAAARVARAVSKWPGMSRQPVKSLTVINWRKQLMHPNNPDGWRVQHVVKAVMAEAAPRDEIQRLLKQGPPGHWKS